MKLLRPWMRGRRAVRIYKVLLVLFVLFNVFFFLVLPPLARHIAERKASEALSRRVTIDSIRVNPYALSLTVRGIRVSDRDSADDFVSVGSIYANAKLASAWKLAPVIGAVYVDDLMVRIVREDTNRFNYSDLTNPKKEEAAPEKPKGKPFRFSFNDIQLHNGRILYEDNVSGRKHSLEEIEIAVPFVSNFAYYIETDVQPHFSARLDGSLIRLDGATRPFKDSRETTLDLNLQDLDLARYVPEAPMPLNFKVPSGSLTLALTLSYVQLKAGAPSLSIRGDAAVSNLTVADLADQPVLRLPEFRLTGLALQPLTGQVSLKEILIREPELNIARSRERQVNLLALLPQPPASTGREPAPAPEERAAAKPPQSPLLIEVDQIALSAGKVVVTDEAAASPFKTTLSPIDLQVQHFTMAPGKRSEYAFKMLTESDEAFSIEGDFSVEAKSLTGKLRLAGLYLPKYAPYYSGALQAPVTDGRLLVEGDVVASQENGAPAGSFTGRVALDKLAVLDKAGEELVKWDALSFNGIKVAFPPASVSIEEILLDKLDVHVVREKDGSLNLAEATAPRASAGAASPAPAVAPSPEPAQQNAPPASVTIGKIALRDGRMEFQDRSIEPNFDTSLDAMNLALTGFALDPTKQAAPGEFHFQAKLDILAPLDFFGRLQPASDNRLVDVTVAFRDVQLSSLTPFSDKYIGYPLTKGKLVLDVKCVIHREQLGLNVHILLDQLTLGDHVDSPTAMKLPIKFALALLRDRFGRITLDVPISGTFSDPKFRLGPLIVQTLVNLVERAVTSPFAFLAGSEEMRYVEFDYGSDVLIADSVKKLDAIAKLLADRPALRMDIQAQTVSGPDEEALRKMFFDRKIKAGKLKEMIGQGAAVASLADVQVAPEEYERYLKLAYGAEDIPGKPRNFIGVAKDVPREEMERRLLEHTAVTPDDLRRLAYNRAAKVRDYLLAAQEADASRLFLIEPESVTAAGATKPRVNFELHLAEGGPTPAEKPFASPPAPMVEKLFVPPASPEKASVPPAPVEKASVPPAPAAPEPFHFRH
jgi:uncharacterized protein involved in outer membrane biogenesis